MTIIIHEELIQGSEAWLAARCGILTASEMKLIVTKTLRVASNDKERIHLFELMAQRITKYVEPKFVSDSMLRGTCDEIEARALYAERYAPVTEVGFISNDRYGFVLGYSPDGLVGDDGLIECKSRGQRFQIETITECFAKGLAPEDYLLQLQTGLLVSEREWVDFISYSGGLPMIVIRVFPDNIVHDAILDASIAFEKRLVEKMERYRETLLGGGRWVPTERKVEMEMFA